MWSRPALAVALLAVSLGLLTSCGSTASEKPKVVAAFYPLEYVAQRIAGEHAEVISLTSPGVEPHDVELAPARVAALSSADVVFYERGFQPAVDDALRNDRPEHVVDAADTVDLQGSDPHFWLDPHLLGRSADAFTRELARALPSDAADFEAANRRFQADLHRLDADFREGLEHCQTRTVVVSHEAFDYLGDRYQLDFHAITGLSPSSEPSARRLDELRRLVAAKGVRTVFSERLVSPALAEALATEAGVQTGVLDPIEGLSGSTAQEDYLSLMRANLEALRKGNRCR